VAADQPLLRQTRLLQADTRCGTAFLDGHERRFAKINPNTEIVFFKGRVFIGQSLPQSD
jgi:hypothetical protein